MKQGALMEEDEEKEEIEIQNSALQKKQWELCYFKRKTLILHFQKHMIINPEILFTLKRSFIHKGNVIAP